MKIMSSPQYKSDVTIVIGRVPETKKNTIFTKIILLFGRRERTRRERDGGRGKERKVKKRNSNNITLKLKSKYNTVRQNEAVGYRLLFLCVLWKI